MKVVYFGSDIYSAEHLRFLMDQGCDIGLVVTQPDRPKGRGRRVLPTPVKSVALERGIEVVHPGNILELVEVLSNFDLGILISFGRIVPKEVLNAPRYGIFNVHPSLLPKYRGASPINRVLENGETETGVTIIKLVSKLDAGPVVLQRRVEIFPFENFGKLERKLIDLGKELLGDFLALVSSGNLELREQDESLASYAPKITKKDLIVDFSKPCEVVKNKIRAYDPKPGAFSRLNEQVVKLFEVSDMVFDNSLPGVVEVVTKSGGWVGCKDGRILLRKIQFPGKKPMSFLDAKNGGKLKEGDVFTLPEI